MKYVALLRGIAPMNPNMHNDKLRGLFEKLGFENVQTVIASGNVLFETDARLKGELEAEIEEAFPKELGYSCTTIIRSQQDIDTLLNSTPFGDREDTPTSRLNVTFLKHKPKNEISLPYSAENKGYTVLFCDGVAVFSVVDLSGAKTPDVMWKLEKMYGKEITTRTWKTVMKISKKFDY